MRVVVLARQPIHPELAKEYVEINERFMAMTNAHFMEMDREAAMNGRRRESGHVACDSNDGLRQLHPWLIVHATG